MIHYKFCYILLASYLGVYCIISNIHVHANPIAENSNNSILEESEPVSVVGAADGEVEPEFPASSKGGPPLPFAFAPFFASSKPTTSGNAGVTGEVQGIYAMNNNTLISYSDPGSGRPAIASLTSEAFYAAQPVNSTVSEELPDGSTAVNSLAGLNVMAVEQTQAYAEGDRITFINHGGSFASGFGDSAADAETNNTGPVGPGWSKN